MEVTGDQRNRPPEAGQCRARLTVLYGSQTGTAEDLAQRIGREARRRLFECEVCALDELRPAALLDERLALFVVATTGQGDVPDNMAVTWRQLLRRDLPADSLRALRFGVIALGDSSYAKFNYVGKRLQKRLLQLGAAPLQPPALGDDQHDLGADAAVDPWLGDWWDKLDALWPLPDGWQLLPADRPPPARHTVRYLEENGSERAVETPPLPSGRHFVAKVRSNRRLTPEDHFQEVRLIGLDVSGADVTYRPGDVATVLPQNLAEETEQLLELLGWRPDQLVMVDGPRADLLPRPCSLRYLATHVLDIHAVPRRSLFELLAYFTESELEREKLTELSSAVGQEERFDYCDRPRRTTLEVLQDFWATARRLPLDLLLDMLPVIRERHFSIASSPKVHGGELQLLVAVVRYRSRLAAPRRGLCSTWLSRLPVGHSVTVSVRPGTLRFPAEPDRPVVMIGPGTGVAPFRSYIAEETAETDRPRPLCLFFGCRNQTADLFFGDEWQRLEDDNKLQLFCAFSRDQENKIYVQDRIREQAALVWRLVHAEGATICVAGSAKRMPEDVAAALQQVFAEQGDMSAEEAECYRHQLERQGRYQTETWS
ncbi:NADPH-dependent diflavin oxidoreductase 1-like [Amphibalanus amphitrite]|uniref:NADPH-dependent diflavin oxidoreductase 1-like n=1 Tax=Amphibalanus amphitrite TaxID=1232801 RepID=UPI001C90C213|nr:NADPH-dependent diflavin oxidoreductase 1-like [Amphibalanus amphitrite]